jgi:hypothetical protein
MLHYHDWAKGSWRCGSCLYWEPNAPTREPGYMNTNQKWNCLHPFSQEDEVGRSRKSCDFFILKELFDYTAWEHSKIVRLKKDPREPDRIPRGRRKDPHSHLPKEPKREGKKAKVLKFRKEEDS